MGQFVLLRGIQVGPELKVVLADDLGNIVAIAVDRVRVHRPIRNVACVLSNAIEHSPVELESRQLAPSEAVLE